MSKEIEQYEQFVRVFQNEVKRRKEILRCGLEGVADEADIRYGRLIEGQTKPKFSAEVAIIHMKGIQTYEQILEICKESLEQLKQR